MLDAVLMPLRKTRGSRVAAGPKAGRTFVIMNPRAGHARTERLRRRLEQLFARHGALIDVALTEAPGHATLLAREAAAAGYRTVVAVGGDGTLAETAAGLAGTPSRMALIPRGTANQVAANLGIPRNVDAAVQVALYGREVQLDVGSIDGRVFALAAGAGFDAAVMARATAELKEKWGFGAYIYATLMEAVTAPRTHYRIVADGNELHVRAMSVLIANVGALYTTFPPVRMPITPEPDAAWRDGLFDVVILEPNNLPQFAGVLARIAVRGFGGEGLLHLRAREVSVEADPVVACQIDGDPAGSTPFVATVLPGMLNILTPRPGP